VHSGDQLPASYDDSNVTRIEDVVTWPRHMRALRSYSLMPGLRRRKQCFHSRNRRGAVRGTESGPSVCVWPVLLQSSHSSHAEKVGRWPEHSRRLCRGHDNSTQCNHIEDITSHIFGYCRCWTDLLAQSLLLHEAFTQYPILLRLNRANTSHRTVR
jgi:hypothetical protein